jgi:hypothetical protein
MLRPQILIAGILFAFAVVCAPRNAEAVHKNWVLENAGSECTFTSPNPSFDNYSEHSLYNGSTSSRNVSCPVALSARWGAANAPIPRWAAAWAANVYVKNQQPGTAFSCTARARLASNVIRFSRSVSTSAGGDVRLTPAFSDDWGGGLEAAETDIVRSMDFSCNVPPNYSGIYGYRVRICQNTGNATCWNQVAADTAGESTITTTEQVGTDWVQTSGIQCMAPGNNQVTRGFGGLTNNSSGFATVLCPIVPPADDTNESMHDVVEMMVHFSPAQINVFPTCQLFWRDRQGSLGIEKVSAAFTNKDLWGRVGLHGPLDVRLDLALAVSCDLPAGMTLQGITARIEVADVSGGGG